MRAPAALLLVTLATPLWLPPVPAQARRATTPELRLARAKDPLLREAAAQVLGLRGSPAAETLLLQKLASDKNRWVRARCAEALGRMGSPRAMRALRSALEREKNQRVRRAVAEALTRLGQRRGIEELMWQLKAGTNHTKAEVSAFLIDLFGQPLGQDVKAWWAFLSRVGYQRLARRPAGAQPLLELRRQGKSGAPPRLWTRGAPAPWQSVPAVVLDLSRVPLPVTPAALRRLGPLPRQALLLLHTGWHTRPRKLKPPARAKARRGPPQPITAEAVRYLLQQAPDLVGLGVDAPRLGRADGQPDAPRDLLLAQDKLVLERLGRLELLPQTGVRLLITPRGTGKAGANPALVLALLR